jgi:hypothetical protein
MKVIHSSYAKVNITYFTKLIMYGHVASSRMQILMNAKTAEQIRVTMEHAKIPMDLMSAFVNLDISWIQVEYFVLVSFDPYYNSVYYFDFVWTF